MSDIPNPPQPERSQSDLAGKYGLTDGQFRVQRSAKDEKGEHLFDEGGWSLKEVYSYTDPKSGETKDYARVELPDRRYKNVPLHELLSWQPQPEAGLDEDTIPREVLDRIKSDLMDMGEPPVEEQVELPEEAHVSAKERLIRPQIEQVLSGDGHSVIEPFDVRGSDVESAKDETLPELEEPAEEVSGEEEQPEADAEKPGAEREGEVAKDNSAEKSRDVLNEIFGSRQEVERGIDMIHAALQNVRGTHLKVGEELEHLERSLRGAQEALSVAMNSGAQPSYVRHAQEMSQGALDACKILVAHAERLDAEYISNLGASSPYHLALDKFVAARARMIKEAVPEKGDNQTAEHMRYIIDLLYKADSSVLGTDRLLAESANDIRRLIARFNETVQHEGLQSANPNGLQGVLQMVRDIMERTSVNNNSLLTAKNSVIELNQVVQGLYR